MKINFLICLVLLLSSSNQSAAFVGGGVPRWGWEDLGSTQAVSVLHPYRGGGLPPRWALYRHGLLDLRAYGELLLRQQGLAHVLEVVARPRDRRRVDYRYRLGGHDVCNLRTALTRLRDGHIYWRGHYPTAMWSGDTYIWPARELAVAQLEEVFVAARVLRIDTVTRCLLATTRGYVPVYDFNVRVGTLPYRVRTDGHEVLEVQPQFYDLQGEFYVYRENSVRSGSKERFLIEIDTRGRLSNRYFDAVGATPDGGDTWRLKQSSNTFNYNDTDREMAQVSAFAHANLMLQWFKGLGFSWYGNWHNDRGNNDIVIVTHANYDPIRQIRNPNNAFYAPPFLLENGTWQKPHILVGDGDGRDLQNLALDGDVIAHELGHHIIYQYLPVTGGHAGTIHEGLADFFTFARTGNPCLAESTCPDGSTTACQLEAECMRYADHDFAWRDLQGYGVHVEGQVLSGMLWDLRTEFGVIPDDVNRIVFNAVSHFTPQTQLAGFIDSLLVADRDLFAGNNCANILNAALGRGLQDYISPTINCRGVNSPLFVEEESTETSTETSVEEASAAAEKNEGYGYTRHQGGCGTILSSPVSFSCVLIILLLPLLLAKHTYRRF